MSNADVKERFHEFPFTEDVDSVGFEFDVENWLVIHRMATNTGDTAPGFWPIACLHGEEYHTRKGTVLSREEAGEMLVSFRDRTSYWLGFDWQR